MKKLVQLFTLVTFSMIFFISCKDDEPKIDPIIGEWELNEVSYSDASSEFSRFNGGTDDNVYGETKYTITFNSDQTYLRELKIQGGTFEDDGEWELDGDELILDQDDSDLTGLILEFDIEEDITVEELVISANAVFFAYPDAIVNDPLALDTLDTATDEEIEAFNLEHIEQFSMTVTLELEKQ